MRTRILALLNVAFFASTVAIASLPFGSAVLADDQEAVTQATEDIVYMNDGRELHGKVLSETRLLVVFEYVDPSLQIKTKLTLLKDNIIKIDRDVAVEAKSAEPTKTAAPVRSTSKPATTTRTYGTSQVRSAAENVPSIYVVPMKGQLGTDIRADVYKPVIDDIRAHKPDMIVLDVDCSDTSEMMFPEGYDTPPVPPDIAERIRQREWGMLDLQDYRDLVQMFRDGLRDIPQVVWIHDSDGISATVFMSWDKIYMAPNARLGSRVSILDKTGANKWQDSDVRAKMIAAWQGMATAFLEKGGYSIELANAMLDPKAQLSCDWKGRTVEWRLNTDGMYAVDTSDKHTTYFRAKTAEDFCLSQGTAEDLNDLALLLGYREYRLVDGRQRQLTDDYVAAWRKTYLESQKWMRDYLQHMGWASGNEALKWLGRAKIDIEKILAAMNRYKAVEIRWEQDFGVPKLALEILVEQMKEEIQALKRNNGNTGGRPGGGNQGGGAGGKGIG